ncbi:hypothetical protein HU200_020912 [Digitaria exilis]|uniref:Uncharacterized protein n=1 Tax=Digitaria exilis TaxID=1010633 RepID=A0A835KDF4_9POAL|nr:hypothetical protein HU200_020912 [Digitaria exilis]CAB3472471.1 unnamed protein product [Digitaria exilis]
MASHPPPATVIQMPSRTRTNGGGIESPAAKCTADYSTAISTGTATDKVMSSAANLAQLLPTGTVLAYQALSPSFTNHGTCYPANRWLTATLVVALAAFSLFFYFTDSVVGRDGKVYYGELRKVRLRPLDYVHAFFGAVVFLAVAFSDAGLQRCFFARASGNADEVLKNLPLGMAFLSSFVYMIFPTKRKGIGYNDTTPAHHQKA